MSWFGWVLCFLFSVGAVYEATKTDRSTSLIVVDLVFIALILFVGTGNGIN